MKKSWTLRRADSGHHTLANIIWPTIKQLLASEKPVVVSIAPESKTRDQEKHYHWIIGHAARQAQHLGAKWSLVDWKRLLVDLFARETGRPQGRVIPNLDGTGVVEVGIQTRNFNRTEGSEFIEWLMAWCALNGVELPEYVPDLPEWAVDQETGEILLC